MDAVARKYALAALGAVAVVWAVVMVMVAHVDKPAVPIAGAIDLTATCSLAVYFLAVRRGHLPRWVLTVVALAGAVMARVLLVRSHANVASAALVEVLAIALVVARGGRVTSVMLDELRVVGFAFAGWRAPRRDARTFTVHRTGGWPLFAGVLVGLTLLETPCAHLVLVAAGHPVAAWIATGLSAYGAVWLVGDALAMRHGGVIVHDDALELRIGVRWRGRISRAAIAKIARGAATEGALDVSILAPNVIVTLREPVTLRGLLGRRRTAARLALSIDEPERFVTTLQ